MSWMASIRPVALLLLLLTLAYPLRAAERTRAEAEALTKKVLGEAIIIDTHADTPQMMLDEGYDLSDPASPYMISIPKMRKIGRASCRERVEMSVVAGLFRKKRRKYN